MLFLSISLHFSTGSRALAIFTCSWERPESIDPLICSCFPRVDQNETAILERERYSPRIVQVCDQVGATTTNNVDGGHNKNNHDIGARSSRRGHFFSSLWAIAVRGEGRVAAQTLFRIEDVWPQKQLSNPCILIWLYSSTHYAGRDSDGIWRFLWELPAAGLLAAWWCHSMHVGIWKF